LKTETKPQRHVRKYTGIKRDKQSREIPCAWDTETDGLNGSLLALSYCAPDTAGLLEPDQLESFFMVIESHPYPHVWYAHNAQYDWRYILPQLLARYDCQFLNRTDNDIFAIRCMIRGGDGDHIDLRDSAALWAGNLKSLIATFAPHLPKLELDFNKVTFDIHNPAHRAYAMRDAEGLMHAMIGYRKVFADLFGCHLGYTSAGSAMKAWRKTIEKPFYCLSRGLEEKLREAYYGGLVFMTDNNPHNNCQTFDINSSYPASMLDFGVPYGRPVITKRLTFDKPGFWHVTVEAPDPLLIPILPTHDAQGVTVWPSGTFITKVASCELELALKHGYKIHAVHNGILFPEIIKPFDKIIGHCKHLRETNDKESPLSITAKLMQNSLYGKFASKFERKEIFYADPYNEDCADYELLEGLDLYTKIVDDQQTLRMVHWSAWITAQSRVRLLTAAYTGGAAHVLYGDTDSLTVTKDFNTSKISIGSDYGQFKLEKTWALFRAHAPKVYAGVLSNGECVGKAKGLPRKIMGASEYRNIIDNKPLLIHYESVPSLTSIIKGKEQSGFGTKKRHRGLTNLAMSRNWVEGKNGKISARPLAEKKTG